MRRLTLLAFLLGIGVMAGCASVSTYTKPEAPWATIKKVGVFPLETSFEDRVRRQWATELFMTELKRLNRFEVVELTPPPPSPAALDPSSVARVAGVDAYFRGTVEEMTEIFADLELVDAATGETLWSSRYHRGAGPDLSMRFHTPQQQLQRIYRIVLHRLSQNLS
ncbi:MAG: hypothetical protein HYZ93_06130 [Candidatus Omnitrophica bacterium]|nr:hypothetical protein [Candidatus Omnitrophota bacterium]